MKVVVRMQQEKKDGHITEKIKRRTRFALSRFGSSIQSSRISFSDINGPKGGVDTRCVVCVKLFSAGEIVVQGEAEDIYIALNYCLARVERAINRQLEKRRDIPIRLNRRIMAREGDIYLSDKET